jgi:hypothetical protein
MFLSITIPDVEIQLASFGDTFVGGRGHGKPQFSFEKQVSLDPSAPQPLKP